jgi:hypothetical protein
VKNGQDFDSICVWAIIHAVGKSAHNGFADIAFDNCVAQRLSCDPSKHTLDFRNQLIP